MKYRSKLEKQFHDRLPHLTYEQDKLTYVIPASTHKYTPDFHIPGTNIYWETKGKFDLADRKKHLLIKEQHPDKRIILVLQAPNQTLTKSSRTTYASWCDKNGLEWMSVEHAINFVRNKEYAL
jgi:hypothetical protein